MNTQYIFTPFRFYEQCFSYVEVEATNRPTVEDTKHFFLSLPTNDFTEDLDRLSDFYFIPKNHAVHWWKNIIEKLTHHALYLLQLAEKELHSELFSLAKWALLCLVSLMDTHAWKSNQLRIEEIYQFNQYVKDKTSPEVILRNLKSPLISKQLSFYIYQKENMIISKTNVHREEYNAFEPYVLHYNQQYSVVQKLECSIGALCEQLLSLKPKKSLKNPNINYIFGETDDYIHEEAIHTVHMFGMFLGYLTNSTSWLKNELFPFDKFELERKSQIHISEEYCLYYMENIQ